MKTPTIIVNFKTYENATGKKALELAKICETVAKESSKEIAVAVQAVDIRMIAEAVDIPILAQHINGIGYGSHTGYILPEAAKEAGAAGTLLNHSEHQISEEKIEKSIARAKELGLMTIVCANDTDKGVLLSKYKPDMIAVEPPELIGGDISVSTAQPELIKDAVARIPLTVLVGAGVKTKEDIKIALELGAKGVLLASGVTKAKDPEAVLRDLASGMK